MKKRIYALLEWIDADLLACRFSPLCNWLRYSPFWDGAREEEDEAVASFLGSLNPCNNCGELTTRTGGLCVGCVNPVVSP